MLETEASGSAWALWLGRGLLEWVPSEWCVARSRQTLILCDSSLAQTGIWGLTETQRWMDTPGGWRIPVSSEKKQMAKVSHEGKEPQPSHHVRWIPCPPLWSRESWVSCWKPGCLKLTFLQHHRSSLGTHACARAFIYRHQRALSVVCRGNKLPLALLTIHSFNQAATDILFFKKKYGSRGWELQMLKPQTLWGTSSCIFPGLYATHTQGGTTVCLQNSTCKNSPWNPFDSGLMTLDNTTWTIQRLINKTCDWICGFLAFEIWNEDRCLLGNVVE